MPFETDRLIFRSPIPDDAEFYASLENNPQVKRFLGGPSGHSADYYRESLTLPRRKDAVATLTVIHRDSGALVGRAGILPLGNQEIEVHCVLSEEERGKGFGLEIVTGLVKLCKQLFPGKKIAGKVHPDNAASICITKKLGFREEGLTQSDGYDNGFWKLILE